MWKIQKIEKCQKLQRNSKFKNFKKIWKKSCTYLTTVRTTVFFFAPKWQRTRPVQKWQISCQKFKFSDLRSDMKFVDFLQGVCDDISVRNLTRWCVPCSGTCIYFFRNFLKSFKTFFCPKKRGAYELGINRGFPINTMLVCY